MGYKTLGNIKDFVSQSPVAKGIEQATGSSITDTVASAASTVADTASDVASTVSGAVSDTAKAIGKYNIVGKVSDFLSNVPDPLEAVQSGVQGTGAATQEVIESVAKGDFGTTQAQAWANNFFNPTDFTETMLSDAEKNSLIEAVKSANKDGRGYFVYGDFGTSNKETLKTSMLESFTNPKTRMSHFVGSGGKIYKDEEGNTIVEDKYDFNVGPKRKAFMDAITKGEVDVSLMSDATPIEWMSMFAYAAQEARRKLGKRADSQIKINLGKID